MMNLGVFETFDEINIFKKSIFKREEQAPPLSNMTKFNF